MIRKTINKKKFELCVGKVFLDFPSRKCPFMKQKTRMPDSQSLEGTVPD